MNNAIRKYGWEMFELVVLAKCHSVAELDATETKMIASHRTMYPHGYNILDGPAYTPGSNPVVMAKRAETMTQAEPRARIGRGVKQARANRSQADKERWVENVRLAQTTPEMLEHRARKQTQARAGKTEQELAEWNRKAAEGMQKRAADAREKKLATMTEEQGRKWLAKLEATRRWRAKTPKVKTDRGWGRAPASSKSRPSEACARPNDRTWMLPSDDEE